MPSNPLLRHIVTDPADRATRQPRPPVVNEGVIQPDLSILLVTDTDPLPPYITHSLPAGTRIAVLHANNRVYMLGPI
jgi:hypothetical protein